MGKIEDWMISEGMTKKDFDDLCCPNGSFTCGLLTKLKMKGRCNLCKSLSKTQANPEDLSTNSSSKKDCCSKCGESLFGKSFAHDNGKWYCLKCSPS